MRQTAKTMQIQDVELVDNGFLVTLEDGSKQQFQANRVVKFDLTEVAPVERPPKLTQMVKQHVLDEIGRTRYGRLNQRELKRFKRTYNGMLTALRQEYREGRTKMWDKKAPEEQADWKRLRNEDRQSRSPKMTMTYL